MSTAAPEGSGRDGDLSELTLDSPRGRIALLATVGASSMASLDATVVTIALPHMGDDLGGGVTSLQWVLTGYLLALASLMLLGGALGDRFGRRRIFVLGTWWFAGGSLLCGLAPTMGVLIAARILQGVGGALLTPGSLAILQSSFHESDRARAIGAWSGLGAVAGAISPFVGGVLVDGPGWRWAFLVNLPLSALVLACTHGAVPETRGDVESRLDRRGTVLGVVGLATGTWALVEAGRRGLDDTGVLVVGAVSVVVCALFVLHVQRTPHALVPKVLFRSRTFTVVNIGTVSLYAAISLGFFLVPYHLQVAAGWSALTAGVALLPATLLLLALSARSGDLGQRIGPRPQLTIGPLLTGAGLLLLLRIGPDTTWARDVLPGSIVYGLGLATFVAPLTASVMGSAARDHVNVASAVNNAVARTASLAAIAVVPVIAALPSAVGAEAITDSVRTGLLIAAGLAAVAGPVMAIGLSWRAGGAPDGTRPEGASPPR